MEGPYPIHFYECALSAHVPNIMLRCRWGAGGGAVSGRKRVNQSERVWKRFLTRHCSVSMLYLQFCTLCWMLLRLDTAGLARVRTLHLRTTLRSVACTRGIRLKNRTVGMSPLPRPVGPSTAWVEQRRG
jgi:hypothetical protein